MSGKIANNLGSLPVVFESGNGSVLTDINGKTYIDFVSGIGVNCLGHNHPALTKAIAEQAKKIIHVSNYYNSDKGLAFSEKLLERTGMDRVYFCNSGAEANENAIKIARKCGSLSDKKDGKAEGTRHTIVALVKSFHGRTVTTLSATGQDIFHNPVFAPYTPGFRYIPANDYDALKDAFDGTVCALLLECVQGEGGVNMIDRDWALAACAAARKAGAVVIADEVQTGIGRTGTFLASEALGINPEIISLAKGIAGGVPMGATLFRGVAAESIVAGDLQTTFGGNPLACAAGLVVLDELAKPGFLSAVTEKGDYIRSKIASWNLPCIKNIRGRGLMMGFDIDRPSRDIQKICLDMAGDGKPGLCISTAGANTLRFLPPLVITEKEIDTGLEILYTVLNQ
ncbi:acetylornithine/succinylornithine family transaminase [Brucepastera parasyntrophica]|uniref:aspartate aminotransferase family protein n=1 Tax=Brucepastera parasyntrophica TaxID=2880008 RepID=UPI002108DD1E|nr:acetylornithine/succinylornithine family transaminase [Brucepastera parasyntrophica]ULQ59575.1 acetylornithine/succinylornithine family transaminase [Brucepastera parasyntrophica]